MTRARPGSCPERRSACFADRRYAAGRLMASCRDCGCTLEAAYRFCPWCAAPQRQKLVEFFRAHPLHGRDSRRALRVSRYLGPTPEERHVRFSVWSEEGRAEAAVSLDEGESARLCRFLGAMPAPAKSPLEQVAELLRLR